MCGQVGPNTHDSKISSGKKLRQLKLGKLVSQNESLIPFVMIFF